MVPQGDATAATGTARTAWLKCATAARERMNADIPYLRCHVRRSVIGSDDGLEEAYAFAIQSIRGRALGLHVMLKSGAHYRGVPLHAVVLSPEAPSRSPRDLAYWDCFSSKPIVTVFDYLRDHECLAYLPSKQSVPGVYLFTVDWLPDDSIHPGFILQPDQNKCGHVIALKDGNLAMLPTNKVAWRDGYWIGGDPSPEKQGYVVQTSVYHAESCERDFSNSEMYFYGETSSSPGG